MNNIMACAPSEVEKFLTGKDLSLCDADTAVDVIGVAQRCIAQWQALQLQAVHRLAMLRGSGRHAGDEVALELAVSRQSAQNLVVFAETLCTRLPKLLSAMRAGEIDASKARKVFDVIAPLSDEKTLEVDDVIADRLVGKDPAQVRRITREAVHKIDPEGSLKAGSGSPGRSPGRTRPRGRRDGQPDRLPTC